MTGVNNIGTIKVTEKTETQMGRSSFKKLQEDIEKAKDLLISIRDINERVGNEWRNRKKTGKEMGKE